MILIYFLILGISTSLLFPPYFMLPLGFITFPLLIKLISKLNKFNSINTYFYSGFWFGFGFLSIFLIWIFNPFLVFEETKNYAAISIILILFLSSIFGFSFIFFKFIQNDFYRIVFIPLLFTLIEIIFANIIYGFPWVSFSLVGSNNIVTLNVIKVFGTYFTSFLTILLFITPYLLINFIKEKKIIFFVILFYLTIFIIFIILNISMNVSKKMEKLNIDIIQLNNPIISEKNHNSSQIADVIKNHILSSQADIIVFAENNYPFVIEDLNQLKINNFVKKGQTVIIGGTRKENNEYFNSFILGNSSTLEYFDKKILVPFGEFIPLREYLSIFEFIAGTNDYSIGTKDRLIKFNDNYTIIPVICYEIIFFWKLINDINLNADFIINITNDSWFGNYVGPYQHFYLAKLRAAEFNKPLIRASNNGISAIIDQNGKVLKSTSLNKKQILSYKLQYYKSSNMIKIHKYFNLLLIVLILFFVYLIFIKNEKFSKI